MEVILTQLKDFSSKSVTFNSCSPAEVSSLRYYRKEDGPNRQSLDIESALAFLRKELIAVRSLDQRLIKQLMELHAGIQDLKQEYSDLTDTGSNYHQIDNPKDVYLDIPVLVEPFLLHKIPLKKISCRRSSMP